ncbi:hypothetical protein EDD21DRAFT_447078 [Dissophora ornata]|nr:hypothetical protein EDD21DRAFT_447078 [Dissophora ornata]
MEYTSSYQDAPLDHEHYRTMARKTAAMRKNHSKQSQAAYKSGNGAKAKELSLKAKQYELEMDRYNDIAKRLAFREYNQSRPRHELDLHGLRVQEAIDITKARLTEFVKDKEPNLTIIVGQGRNSLNGVAKIKPAITELVKEYHVKATPNKPNQGCIYIEHLLMNEDVDYSWMRGYGMGGYGMGGYGYADHLPRNMNVDYSREGGLPNRPNQGASYVVPLPRNTNVSYSWESGLPNRPNGGYNYNHPKEKVPFFWVLLNMAALTAAICSSNEY